MTKRDAKIAMRLIESAMLRLMNARDITSKYDISTVAQMEISLSDSISTLHYMLAKLEE